MYMQPVFDSHNLACAEKCYRMVSLYWPRYPPWAMGGDLINQKSIPSPRANVVIK